MDERGAYRGGGTAGGKCGCAAAALIGFVLLPILGLFFMGDCEPREQCHGGGGALLFGGLFAIAAVASAAGLGVRSLVNRFIAWNRRPRAMTRQEVAVLLQKCIDDTASHSEIDYFISVDIVDPLLDDVRCEVGVLHGPGWGSEETKARLREQLERVEGAMRTSA